MKVPSSSIKQNATAVAVEPLISKEQLAPIIGRSTRAIDNDIAARRYPFIRVTPRCIRFRLSDVLAALAALEVKAVGQKQTATF